MARIYHLATAAEWEAARASGSYTTSTRGRTLAEEGFLHASRADQWEGVRQRYYADVTEPLVLLVVETDLLDVPVVEEVVPGGTETYPHVYGPLDPGAVVEVLSLTLRLRDGGPVQEVGGSASGSRTRTRVPWPCRLSTSTSPPWASTIPLTIGSPRPAPGRWAATAWVPR